MDKPHIRLKSYSETPNDSRWITHWRIGARNPNMKWMKKAMLYVRERNRAEGRGIYRRGI